VADPKRWLALLANVVLSATRNRDGVLIGFTKVTRDLSERKRAAEKWRARAAAVVGADWLYALQTAQLDQVIERSMQTIRETLQIDDFAFPRRRVAASGRDRSIHAPEPDAEYGFRGIRFRHSLQTTSVPASHRQRAGRRDGAQPEREQLRRAEREAARARKHRPRPGALLERDEFVSVAAHELRTPLTALQLKLQAWRTVAGSQPKRSAGRRASDDGSRDSSIASSMSPDCAGRVRWRRDLRSGVLVAVARIPSPRRRPTGLGAAIAEKVEDRGSAADRTGVMNLLSNA